MEPYECQVPCLESMSEGLADLGPRPLRKRVGTVVRRYLSPSTRQRIKRVSNRFLDWIHVGNGTSGVSPSPITGTPLNAGDLVRVRSRDEIKATLDHWGSLKGCSFMPEMWPYCDTTQRVLKPMNHFFDERDYKLRRTRGIILLEGTICQGTALFGQCDRACFFFWREEWLEKVEAVSPSDER
jgi:hypothetical protein